MYFLDNGAYVFQYHIDKKCHFLAGLRRIESELAALGENPMLSCILSNVQIDHISIIYEQISLKILEKRRTASLNFNSIGSYKKNECSKWWVTSEEFQSSVIYQTTVACKIIALHTCDVSIY